MEGLTYKYYKKNKSKNIYLIIHGGGPVGVETDFISAIFDTIANSIKISWPSTLLLLFNTTI